MLRKITAFALILCGIFYLFVAFQQFPILLLAAQGKILFFDAFLLYLQTPLLMLHYGEIVPTLLLFLSALLSSLYIHLFLIRIAYVKAHYVRFGLSGSLLSIMSIGCVTCGALLSPLALFTSIGVPLAILGHAEILLGIIANILLAAGIFLLYKERGV